LGLDRTKPVRKQLAITTAHTACVEVAPQRRAGPALTLTRSGARSLACPLAPCACREGLRAELKLLREDLHSAIVQLKERTLRTERLAAKFATLTLKNKPAGEDDEPQSQAYYVIKVGSRMCVWGGLLGVGWGAGSEKGRVGSSSHARLDCEYLKHVPAFACRRRRSARSCSARATPWM
jgi:hypothetical protein